jgi:hypothetical protein
VVLTTGYLLCPISWWNDVFLNLPLAYLIASIFARFFPPLTTAYWLSNLLGMALMHIAAIGLARNWRLKPIQITQNLLIALGYTILLLILFRLGVLKPVFARWKNRG